MSQTVIRVEHLSKRYELGVIGRTTLRRDFARMWARARGEPDPMLKIGQEGRAARFGESILALDDVSFEVKQGEALGIIGRNGAGKSTLLKILSRVTAPSSGVVKVKGRIGSLLEVGTGFHPELTGRENVYLNGAILGMTRAEIDRKFDEIVDFSGVEQFIDTPVKRYSSGMHVRLGFAVAAHLDPEILIVDEVLAVGDAEFQKKCLGKMGDVAGEGRTVLFVSHNMNSIKQLCATGFLLESGKIFQSGDIKSITSKYISNFSARTGKIIDHVKNKTNKLKIISISVNNKDGDEIYLDSYQRKINIIFDIEIIKKSKLSIELILFDSSYVAIGSFSPGHYDTSQIFLVEKGLIKILVELNLPELKKGEYYLDFYITNPSVEGFIDIKNGLKLISEGQFRTTIGNIIEGNSGQGSILLDGVINKEF